MWLSALKINTFVDIYFTSHGVFKMDGQLILTQVPIFTPMMLKKNITSCLLII